MTEFDFSTGLEFGRALERLRHHNDRLDGLEDDLAEVRTQIHGIRTTMSRGGLLVALWTSGGTAWASQERAGEILAGAIKALFRLG